jgi:hypothetical protein
MVIWTLRAIGHSFDQGFAAFSKFYSRNFPELASMRFVHKDYAVL